MQNNLSKTGVQGKSRTYCLILKYSPLLWRFWFAVDAFSSFAIFSLSFAISISWSSSSFAILVSYSRHWFSENWSVRPLFLLKSHGTKVEINLMLAFIFVHCWLIRGHREILDGRLCRPDSEQWPWSSNLCTIIIVKSCWHNFTQRAYFMTFFEYFL